MISIIMKKEALQGLTIVAALLIFGGVYLANKANTKVEEENILEEVK
jgi:drug/metabolite transporter (DMT)-like permease